MRTHSGFFRDFLWCFVGLLVLFSIGLFIDHPWPKDFLTSLFAYGLLAMSLNLLIGSTGLVSFGHAAFFAFGGYCFGLLMQDNGFVDSMGPWSIPIAIALAVVGTGGYAAIIGAICVRLNEIYFAFLTLAFQMFLYSLILSWVDFTGGDQGLMGGIPRPEFLGINLAESLDRYLFCAFLFSLCIFLLRVIDKSAFGKTLRMIRDNTERAEFLGIRTYRVKLMCFIMAGMFASVGGVILALFTSGAYPEWAFWAQSGEAIFMIMLGGMNVFVGPLLGAVTLRAINDVVQMYTSHNELITGIVILMVVLGLRRGILDFLHEKFRDAQQKKKAGVRDDR